MILENATKIAYLASPLAHDQYSVMWQRYIEVIRIRSELFKAGVAVYSPIAENFMMEQLFLRGQPLDHWQRPEGITSTHDLYLTYDRVHLINAGCMIIPDMEGTGASKGIRLEASICTERNIPSIFYSSRTVTARNWVVTEKAFLRPCGVMMW